MALAKSVLVDHAPSADLANVGLKYKHHYTVLWQSAT